MMTKVQAWLGQPRYQVAIAALLVVAIVAWFYGGKFGGEITGFFRIGSVLPLSPFLDPASSKIYPGELGYDGQQFLTLAFDPALAHPESIAALDSPPYRYRRILYPLLGYGLGLGQPAWIPYALVVVNAIALVALVWVISRYGAARGEPRLGLLALTLPGLWITLAFSTADILSTLWVAIALLAYRAQHRGGLAIALALAGLTRETTLVVWLALLLAWGRDSLRSGTGTSWRLLPAFGIALLPIGLWNGYVLLRFAGQGSYGAASNFGPPLVGFGQKLAALATLPLPKAGLEALAFFTLLAAWGTILLAAWRWPQSRDAVAIAALLYTLPLVSSSLIILGYFLDYLRVYLDLFVLLLLAQIPRPLKLLPVAAASLLSAAFVLAHS